MTRPELQTLCEAILAIPDQYEDVPLLEKRMALEDELAENTYAEHILALLSECSRLASRVEELELALKKISTSKKYHQARLTDESMCILNEAIRVAEKLLAGAHAEEK